MLGFLFAALFALMGHAVGDCIETLIAETEEREAAAFSDGFKKGYRVSKQDAEKGADDEDTRA